MGFGGEVRRDVVAGYDIGHQRRVADVAVDERIPGAIRDRGQIGEVARVGELVQHRHPRVLEAGVSAPQQGPDVM